MANVLNDLGGLFTGIVPELMFWGGWILLTLTILAVIVGAYFLMDYKFKITVLERRGGTDSSFSIGKFKTDRAKLVKGKDGVYKYRLLFKRIDVLGIDDAFVYANNKIFLLKVTNEHYVPMRITVKEGIAELLPVDHATRAWAMNEIKQAAIDYQAKSAFEQYGQYFFMVGTVLFCLALTAATVYFTFKYAGGGVDSINGLTSALNTFGNTVGAPVS